MRTEKEVKEMLDWYNKELVWARAVMDIWKRDEADRIERAKATVGILRWVLGE